ncbi:MAG: tRNA uracil 4-sulfurtransferase ThiI [Bacillota bacterium]
MYDVLLIRFGEIALKGKNRSNFLHQLYTNIKRTIKPLGKHQVKKTHGRIYVYPEGDSEKLLERLKMVPGIVSISPGITLNLDYKKLKKKSLSFFQKEVKNYPTTFKVETRRVNKDFTKNSMEISRELGAYLLENINKDSQEKKLKVDVHEPEYRLKIEVRYDNIYIYTRIIEGPGGLPVSSSGKGLLLLSGGIDSPVAGWEAMSRGISLEAIYFHSFPFTGDRAKEKVIDLTKVLSQYGPAINLHIGYFTNIQKAIQEKCPEKYNITIMRRMMYKMAAKLAKRRDIKALITGESVGQVASQTLESMYVINEVTSMPVLRPLISTDKTKIVETAKKIGSYEISIRPYEDCCTVFVPDNPVTKPQLKNTLKAEEKLQVDKLISEALQKSEIIKINESSY